MTLTHLWAVADGPPVAGVTLLDNRSTAPGMDAVLAVAQRRGCQVIRHEANVGVWASVNRGLALARAPWVFVLTADVLLSPHAIAVLASVMAQAPPEVVMLGPVVAAGSYQLGMRALPVLARVPETCEVDCSTYNGAAWLMRWDALRESVGWFDPRFYVAYGDTDYAERIARAGLLYGIIPQLPCVHLDKQSRRRDCTAEQDTDVELRDGARFVAKWADCPDVLARHPPVSREDYLRCKRGWKGDAP